MKRLFFLIMSIIGLTTSAYADDDRPINPDALPSAATQFIKKHFQSSTINRADKIRISLDSIGIILKDAPDGTKIEFDSNGKWKEVERRSSVPSAIVPAPISQYVKKNYPSCVIEKISQDRRGIEIELSNGLDIEFDKSYRVVEIDR